MRGQPSPNARSPRWRSVWVTAGILGTAFASWLAWEQYACRHARAFLAACAQAANARTLPDDEKLRSFVVAFGGGDWQHIIREAGRGETKLEGWIYNNRNRLPRALTPLVLPVDPHVRWNALNKAWLLTSEDLEQRRILLLRAMKEAQLKTQPLLADLCVTFPRTKPPLLTSQLLEEIKAACMVSPELKAYLMPTLSWSALPQTEPAIHGLLEEWTRDANPSTAEGAARTLSRRKSIAP